MTGPDAFDQQLESLLVAEADAPAPTGLHERVLEPSTRQRPRPAWVAWLGSGWASEPPAGRLAAIGWARPVLVAVLILLMLGAAILVAGGPRQPSPSIGPLVYGRDGDIVLADLDGANPVVIADGAPSSDRLGTWYTLAAGWAPDGSHLVYNEVRPGQMPSVITHISDASGRRVSSFVIDGPAVELADRQLKSDLGDMVVPGFRPSLPRSHGLKARSLSRPQE